MKIDKEMLSSVLLIVCMMSWFTVMILTPVGGWNENSSTYQSWYMPAFGIASIAFLISIITHIVVLSKSKASC